MMDELRSSTNITNFTPGSIARTLLEVFNRKLNACYTYFGLYASMTFLSTAEGIYLNMIGEMLGCARLDSSEEDDNYRYRISQQVFTSAMANRTAIRLRCLAIADVKDVIITPYTHGNGSFTIHVITNEIDTPNNIILDVENAVNDVKAEGIKAIVTKPKIIDVDVTFKVILKPGNGISDIALATRLKGIISDYIDEIPMGGNFSIYQMLNIVQSNISVSQVYLNSLYIDGEAIMIKTDYQMDWDKRLHINSVLVSI